jgi:hypothetical protein
MSGHAGVALAAATAAGASRAYRDRRTGIVLGLVVLSHWVLDSSRMRRPFRCSSTGRDASDWAWSTPAAGPFTTRGRWPQSLGCSPPGWPSTVPGGGDPVRPGAGRRGRVRRGRLAGEGQ